MHTENNLSLVFRLCQAADIHKAETGKKRAKFKSKNKQAQNVPKIFH